MTTNPESETSNPSNAELHELIHSLVAKRLVEVLKNPEVLTPQWIAQARGFLADNKVTGLELPGSPLAAVQAEFKKNLPFKLG